MGREPARALACKQRVLFDESERVMQRAEHLPPAGCIYSLVHKAPHSNQRVPVRTHAARVCKTSLLEAADVIALLDAKLVEPAFQAQEVRKNARIFLLCSLLYLFCKIGVTRVKINSNFSSGLVLCFPQMSAVGLFCLSVSGFDEQYMNFVNCT